MEVQGGATRAAEDTPMATLRLHGSAGVEGRGVALALLGAVLLLQGCSGQAVRQGPGADDGPPVVVVPPAPEGQAWESRPKPGCDPSIDRNCYELVPVKAAAPTQPVPPQPAAKAPGAQVPAAQNPDAATPAAKPQNGKLQNGKTPNGKTQNGSGDSGDKHADEDVSDPAGPGPQLEPQSVEKAGKSTGKVKKTNGKTKRR